MSQKLISVDSWRGLEPYLGKDLGYCMRHIRETFGSNHEFETFFELATEEEAAAVIRERAGILSTDK